MTLESVLEQSIQIEPSQKFFLNRKDRNRDPTRKWKNGGGNDEKPMINKFQQTPPS